jgi:Uma2 family endonuclease
MSAIPVSPMPRSIRYPSSDGKPMAENTLQFRWIVQIKDGFEAMYHADPNVFVAGDLLWYPEEGNNALRLAPDTLIVFGRPKGYRGSYRQWEEGGIAPKVVFEVLSPGNRAGEMKNKFAFYERFGVDEYYVFDPDRHALDGFIRNGEKLEKIQEMNGWISPATGVRFDMSGDELRIYRPDGQRFVTHVELMEERDKERKRAEDEKKRAEDEKKRAEDEKKRAEDEKKRAEDEKKRAEDEKKRAEDEKKRAEKLEAQLRALGVKPEA